jgi:uncharacterized protein YecT (DUF1311 family)
MKMPALRIQLVAFAAACAASSAHATDMFGDSYKPCGDAASTAAGVACVAAKTKVWNTRLNADYKEIQGSIDKAQQEPLRAAERLWVQYRDANCRFYGSHEGSIGELQQAECLRAMTQDRALELEEAMKP